jgi:hypothetical protein
MHVEQVFLRFFDRQPVLSATVEIDSACFDSDQPPLRLRGRILKISDMNVESGWYVRQGRHTMSFANDRHRYRFEQVQPGGLWFRAELKPQSHRWVTWVRGVFGV